MENIESRVLGKVALRLAPGPLGAKLKEKTLPDMTKQVPTSLEASVACESMYVSKQKNVFLCCPIHHHRGSRPSQHHRGSLEVVGKPWIILSTEICPETIHVWCCSDLKNQNLFKPGSNSWVTLKNFQIEVGWSSFVPQKPQLDSCSLGTKCQIQRGVRSPLPAVSSTWHRYQNACILAESISRHECLKTKKYRYMYIYIYIYT